VRTLWRCACVSPNHASRVSAEWGANQTTKEDEKLWQDDWDDDEIDNDFCNQLRAQLVAAGVMQEAGGAAEGKK
jgi:hypothetical protein